MKLIPELPLQVERRQPTLFLLDGGSSQGLFDQLLTLDTNLGPFSVVNAGELSTRIEPAMEECFRRLHLDPRRKVELSWQVIMTSDHTFEEDKFRSVVETLASHSRLPFQVTLLVDVSQVVKPWKEPHEDAFLDLLEKLREATQCLLPDRTRLGNIYLSGSSNHFGFVSDQGFGTRQLAALLEVGLRSDLFSWLAEPRGSWGPFQKDHSGRAGGIFAIGMSRIWVPPRPWSELARTGAALRIAEAYRNPHRLATDARLSTWLRDRTDFRIVSSELRQRLVSSLTKFALLNPARLETRYRGLAERQAGLDVLFEQLRGHLRSWSKDRCKDLLVVVRSTGNDLALGGALDDFATKLHSLAARLSTLEERATSASSQLEPRLRLVAERLDDSFQHPVAQRVLSGETSLPRFRRWALSRCLRRTRAALEAYLRAHTERLVYQEILWFTRAARAIVAQGERRALRLAQRFDSVIHSIKQHLTAVFSPQLATDRPGLTLEIASEWFDKSLGSIEPMEAFPEIVEDLRSRTWDRWEVEDIKTAVYALARRFEPFDSSSLSALPASITRRVVSAAEHQDLLSLSLPLVLEPEWFVQATEHEIDRRLFLPPDIDPQGVWDGDDIDGVQRVPARVPWPVIVAISRMP